MGGGGEEVRKWQNYVIERNLFSYGETNRKSVNNFVQDYSLNIQ